MLCYIVFQKTPPSHHTHGEAEACMMLCLSIFFYRCLISSISIIIPLPSISFNFLAGNFAQLNTSVYAVYYSQDTHVENNNTCCEHSESRNDKNIAHAFAFIPHPLLPIFILHSLRDDVPAEENFSYIPSCEDYSNVCP